MPMDANRILIIDPQPAGVSGDMMVAALLDLGAAPGKVIEAMETPRHFLTGCDDLKIAVTETSRRGIRAKRVEVNLQEQKTGRPAGELQEALSNCLRRLEVSERAKRFAEEAIGTIISAETSIHGGSGKEVHLHETASADTLADVIGSAVALDDLGLLARTVVYSTPVAVGGGLFAFSHGTVSSPAPATLEILRSAELHMVGGPVEAELATPTGASLLTALAPEPVRFYPPIKPTSVGYGAGSRDFAEMPNVLRMVLGEPVSYGFSNDEVYVIETNVDDASGEVMGHAMDRLLREGARDVSAIPMFAKKGRPAYCIRVIADAADVESMSSLLIEETGTLGVRLHRCERRTLAREFISVDIAFEDTTELIKVKVARRTEGSIVRVKPEYDDVKRIADSTGKPFREIEALARKRALEVLAGA